MSVCMFLCVRVCFSSLVERMLFVLDGSETLMAVLSC